MSGFIHVGNWLKAQAPPRFFISLCVLAISFISVPHPGKFPDSTSAPISSYLDYLNFASVPFASTVNDDLHRVDRAKGRAYRRAVSAKCDVVLLAQRCRHSISNYCGISDCLSSFNGICKTGLQQACQLLDIPPPSDSISF